MSEGALSADMRLRSLGMTSTANERLIYLDDLLGIDGFDDIDRRDGEF